jgi:hypothetical protein
MAPSMPSPGVQQPLPYQAGGDEGHRVRIQEHRAQHALGAHVLVDEDRQQEADHQAGQHEQHAVQRQVVQRQHPAFVVEQALVLGQADEVAGLGKVREAVIEIHRVQPAEPM